MKLRLKYVGIGLFLAGLLFTLNSQYDFIASGLSTETSNEKALEKKELEIEKLRKQLKELNEENNISKMDKNESQGENASNSNNDSSETNKNRKDEGSVNKSNSAKENDVVTETVIIYENMSLYEIGQQVEDLNLLENGRQLELYLSKPDYARSVQKGSFELSSSMTLEEMASILTAKKTQ
jgi:hypothetical protein